MKISLTLLCAALVSLAAEPVSLFDGKSLEGWEIPPDEQQWWRVSEGAITGGSLEKVVSKNTFLATRKSYANFDLRFKMRMIKGAGEGLKNSGIQVRSARKPKTGHMVGYQVDGGIDYWGMLYDEGRRAKLRDPLDAEALAAKVHHWDKWNEYRILCEGPRLRSWINGVPTIDYTEENPEIPLEGRIGLQAHKAGKFLTQFKDFLLTELPDTPGSKAWPKVSPLSPEDQRTSFKLPEGFEIELVTSEEQGVVKPVTVAWDSSGKLWTMTATEYPVDANENLQKAEALYAQGGADQVLVIDNPSERGPHTPSVFADGLVIPLGLLPNSKGALVQYGTEIRQYLDADRDGQAEGFETVLTGFGIQDSHLFPHQFEAAPGGWVYTAQGRFNNSTVVRPKGELFDDGNQAEPFRQCKLARFRPDGSAFELLCAGPNNIWGLGTGRDGEVFVQEANDMGIPIAEFFPGKHYSIRTGERLRPYAPEIPESLEGRQMGGTGLSGLAIAEDEGSPFTDRYKGSRAFYIANPITNRIQVVTMVRDEDGFPQYQKEEDFMLSDDEWFRPVAIHFGPDGALYVVDWYNKIISHNEVPRTHPDRDKTRGRIWRIKPKGQPLLAMPDLTAKSSEELLEVLAHPNARVARMTWQEIGSRGDKSTVPQLKGLVSNSEQSLAVRLNAFWALETLGALTPADLGLWAADSAPEVRYEVLRAAGDLGEITSADFVKLVRADEGNFRVQSMAATALRRLRGVTAEMLSTVTPFVRAQSAGESVRERYQSDFVRYLVRWAMEVHATEASSLLTSVDLTGEARSLAMLALPPQEGALLLVKFLPELGRPLNSDELGVLGGQLQQDGVAAAFDGLLSDDSTREQTLRSLLNFDVLSASSERLQRSIATAAAELDLGDGQDRELLLKLVRQFRLESLAPAVHEMMGRELIAKVEGLKALNEIKQRAAEWFVEDLKNSDPAVQREALIGYSASAGIAGVKRLSEMWPELSGVQRQLVTDGILTQRETTEAFVLRAAKGQFSDFGASAAERAIAILGLNHPAIQLLLKETEGLLMPVLALTVNDVSRVQTKLDLRGPFTIESWVKLWGKANNADALLGRKKGPVFNFHDGKFRVFDGKRDVVIASQKTVPGVWNHYAVTRDVKGIVRIYLNGELAARGENPCKADFKGLNIGESYPRESLNGQLTAFRHWDRARSADEIRSQFKTSYPRGEFPKGLMMQLPDAQQNPPLVGGSRVAVVSDFPELRTPAEAAALIARFAEMRKKVALPGEAARGEFLVRNTCMICHQIKGEGLAIGPDLSGAGAMGVDALLHNILLPNEQLESGYYRHDVTLKDGSFVSGFLASESKVQLVLRQIGTDDRVIPRKQIASHRVSKRSLMPEGLIDGFDDQQVSDLFAYLMTLK